jgi:DnaJ-class molecular chaperone
MQTVDQFMREYVRNRTELLRESSGRWAAHMQTFFAPAYQPYDGQKTVADSEAESILSVCSGDGLTEVITTGSAGGRWRFRYRLSAVNDRWCIMSMEMECGICHGSGKAKDGESDCRLCKGAGWKLVGETGNG